MNCQTINAVDFLDPDDAVIATADRIGVEIARHLRDGCGVTLRLHGVRGTSSSFFNVILGRIVEVLGRDFPADRFSVDTESAVQKMIYERCLAAANRIESR